MDMPLIKKKNGDACGWVPDSYRGAIPAFCSILICNPININIKIYSLYL